MPPAVRRAARWTRFSRRSSAVSSTPSTRPDGRQDDPHVKPPSVDGLLVVNKPVGPSSHDVVVVARRSLGISRVGHTGTLDPQASGVLPLVLGQATRLARYLSSSDKEYIATLRFGVVSDTRDRMGRVVASTSALPTIDQIDAALEGFRGTFRQTPPAFSAKMVDGERSYARARAGKPVEAAAVAVTVHALELVAFDPPFARLRVQCSAGFYVRSLAHDLGQAVGSGAVLDALVRTEAAGLTLDTAIPFETLVGASRRELRDHVRPMEALLTHLPTVHLTPQGVEWARHGRDLGPAQCVAPLGATAPLVRLIAPDGRLIGLADRGKMPGFLHAAVVFSYN
jgi:tRNA pseudouridine55 synthase